MVTCHHKLKKNLVKLQTCTVSICPSYLKIHSIIRNNVPTIGVGGWGSKSTFRPPHPPTNPGDGWVDGGVLTHVALFMHKVFHIYRFQLESYMSVRYKRVDIITHCVKVLHTTGCQKVQGKYFIERHLHFVRYSSVISNLKSFTFTQRGFRFTFIT